MDSVKALFRKEMGAEIQTALAGKTLYVSFEIRNMITTSFDLPKEVTDQLESAMLSISRISLSTDAEIDFTVIEARDLAWGVETVLIRRMQDLKDLFYWRISKADFDERLVLETRKMPARKFSGADGLREDRDWRNISLPEYMGRLVASRISLGTKANPFLSVLLGIEKVTADYDPSAKTVAFTVDSGSSFVAPSTASVILDLLRNSVTEQMAHVEKKYFRGLEGKEWAKDLIVRNLNGDVLFRLSRKEWISEEKIKRGIRLF